jgi:hypothetical protein
VVRGMANESFGEGQPQATRCHIGWADREAALGSVYQRSRIERRNG